MAFPTPNSVPTTRICRTIQIPDDPLWLAIVNGALSELLDIRNYEPYGTLTPEETANAFAEMFYDYLASDCSTPSGILDDFQRANDSTLGANWTADPTVYGNAMFALQGGQAVSTASNNQAYWNVEAFGSNSQVFVQVVALGEGQEMGFNMCLVDPTTLDVCGYAVVLSLSSGVYKVDIYRTDFHAFTLLQTVNPVTFATGNWLLASKIGATISVQTSPDGVNWTEVGTVEDATYSTGYIGLYSGSGAGDPVVFDNFGGGTLP